MPKKSFVDFAALKASVPIERVIPMLQLEMKRHGEQHRGACPVCESGERSLVITPAKGVFYCFGCTKGGDLIALVAHINKVPMKDAAMQIAEYVGTVPSTVPVSEGGKETEKLQPLSYLDADHEAVAAVGFDADTARELGIGYASKGIMRGTVAIPIRTESGELAGYIGIQEAKLPPRWHLASNVVKFPKTA